MLPKLTVLFLCTGNACRSQMAESWARHLLSDRIEPHSAGIRPGRVDPRAAAVMLECGVDLSDHRSKHLDELADVRFDWVVTVCGNAERTCPVFPGAVRRLHHGFDDPPALAADEADEEAALRHYRRVRDEIRTFVVALPGRLAEAAP